MCGCIDKPCCGCDDQQFMPYNGGFDDPPDDYDPDFTDQDWLVSMHQEREIESCYDDMQAFEDRYCPEAVE